MGKYDANVAFVDHEVAVVVQGIADFRGAWDIDSMMPRWVHQQQAMFQDSALVTAEGLVFIADLDRCFMTFDSDTGQQIWRTRPGAGPGYTPAGKIEHTRRALH